MKKIVAFFAFICVGCGLLWFIGNSSNENLQIYEALMARSDPKSGASPYSARQSRHNVQKDMWFLKHKNPLKMHLQCTHSELVLDHHDEVTEVIENMQQVQCFVQEEIFFKQSDGREIVLQDGTLRYRRPKENDPAIDPKALEPFQIVRHIKSKSATYHYQQDRLVAKDVDISRYIYPGHHLVLKEEGSAPLLSGHADSIEFAWLANDFKFSAEKFKAALN